MVQRQKKRPENKKDPKKGLERVLTHGDLFSGIGGFDLAALWNGVRTVWASDIDEFCNGIYRKRFPGVEVFGDVTKKKGFPKVDLITAGFPCQPVSYAGRRKGKEDERWLWPDTQRVIRLVGPRWVLLENVPGLLTSGMSEVLGGLSEIGYDAEWQVIPAAAFGAPHLRERVWIVAYPQCARGGSREIFPKDFLQALQGGEAGSPIPGGPGLENVAHPAGVEPRKPDRKRGRKDTGPRGRDGGRRSRRPGEEEDVAHPARGGRRPGSVEDEGAGRGVGLQPDAIIGGPGPQARDAGEGSEARPNVSYPDNRRRGELLQQEQEQGGFPPTDPGSHGQARTMADPDGIVGQKCGGKARRTEPNPGCREDSWWATEPDVGRVAHGIPARVDRLKALGNSIVPQVAAWVIARIVEADRKMR